MEFGQAVRKCMIEKYYPLIQGRAARSEFWWFMLFYILVSIGFMIVLSLLIMAVIVPLSLNEGAFDPATGIASMVPLFMILLVMPLLYFMMPPLVAVTIRRLHDRNISGWWYLGFTVASMIPGINLLVMLVIFVLMLLPGTQGPNRFGADPLAPQDNVFS